MNKELHYALMESPVGRLGLVASSRGLVSLDYIDLLEVDFKELLQKTYPQTLVENGEFAWEPLNQVKEYFSKERQNFSCFLDLKGTPFQQKVWQALREIPYGQTMSYEDLAKKVGNIKAVRAVGQANGKNPVAIVVPCHRVIRKSGDLGGYSSGLKIKQFLLDLEQN